MAREIARLVQDGEHTLCCATDRIIPEEEIIPIGGPFVSSNLGKVRTMNQTGANSFRAGIGPYSHKDSTDNVLFAVQLYKIPEKYFHKRRK